MAVTFADESFGSRSWAEHVVLAHINFRQDLDWFFQIIFNLRQRHVDKSEFKADDAIKVLERLDIHVRAGIWKTLHETLIIVQDPKEILKKSGVTILTGENIQFEYKGRCHIIEKGHTDYSAINENLQNRVAEIILGCSPIDTIGFSLSEIPAIPLVSDFFVPEKILGLVSKSDSRKDIINTVKLSARLCSAFYDLIDPDAMRRIVEQLMEYNSDHLFIVPEVHRQLLIQAVTSDRFFDEGHNPSIDLIRRCFDEIGKGLSGSFEVGEKHIHGSVKELDSKNSLMIQACDFAAGIARRIYQEEGLKGLKQRFRCVVFNGSLQ